MFNTFLQLNMIVIVVIAFGITDNLLLEFTDCNNVLQSREQIDITDSSSVFEIAFVSKPRVSGSMRTH